MPYWSSSRVGAVPQQQPQKQKKRNERFGRQKGITMEDLKKQTALRLAQEQNRQNRGRGIVSPFPSSDDRGAYRVAPDPANQLASPSHNRQPRTPPVLPRGYQPMDRSGYSPAEARVEYGGYDRGIGRVAPVVQSAPVAAPSSPQVRSSDFIGSNPTPQSAYQEKSGSQKSKLPHGLTVQELKEMTKARLQAEAASHGQDMNRRVSAEQMAVPSPHDRPVPRTVPVSSSPLPSSFQSARDGWQSEPLSDKWDAQSVGNSSSEVFLSSEPKMTQQLAVDDYHHSQTFGRSTSFASTETHNLGDPSNIPLQNFHDGPAMVEGNRRRAATLSPTAELSFFREDRSLGPDVDGSAAVEITAVGSLRSHSAFSTPPLVNSVSGEVVIGNRQRTSSAASMPAISDTADEFGLESSAQSRFSSQFGSVREDVPVTPGLADVFRVSSFDKSPLPGLVTGADSVGLSSSSSSSVFHNSANANRIRSSTWSEQTSYMFGQGYMDCGEISDDLASILKLSGAEDKSH